MRDESGRGISWSEGTRLACSRTRDLHTCVAVMSSALRARVLVSPIHLVRREVGSGAESLRPGKDVLYSTLHIDLERVGVVGDMRCCFLHAAPLKRYEG